MQKKVVRRKGDAKAMNNGTISYKLYQVHGPKGSERVNLDLF